ncbi:MAG: type I-E CRISPR-associated protein Cas7/Cse4/CasC [Betaproteobacteria bacterium]|jgi:CRISPR system Cascade subunit CasC|nr:type I-E CRISPR-associated protein Cas7/Cse4/CasC [Betaproteobacteria bacterium]HMV21661.1 type I-E CRISPR-associated protein Cas7/Cse4/CasC [Rhodocyclaceae bacterium]HNE15099.1 type I-E CRISPR-associated protein Cas7/Cse4/CasC [Rhodocyclaceae bacterium]HNM81469.1 type I-E CRISPR-associated protein Cas7/Cse4/CasC [Rhodocyclaceae bacterium]
MSRFIQLHLLTNYPPSNLNRDDTGRPKSALVGDAARLRVSSQSQKRAWRTSEAFEIALAGHLGTRTKRIGKEAFDALKQAGVAEKAAREWAKAIAACFGKAKSDKKSEYDEDLEIEQLAHISPEERGAVDALVKLCAERGSEPAKEELSLLRKPRQAVDIAMFGRMLADSPEFNMEAAVQVSHAITVHKSAVEDDYFSAIDDLNRGESGASHIGERGYGAGLFYLYLCINRELLRENLGGDDALTGKALEALIHAVTKVSPTGMQNSFASRAYASYVLAEKGDQQPRSLVQAFLKPVKPFEDEDMLEKAVKAIEKRRDNFDRVYGACADARYTLNVDAGEGRLSDLVTFVQE